MTIKRIAVVSASVVLFACSNTHAQTGDVEAIRQTALNYIEGYYNADFQRMSKAIHPELVKRIISRDTLGNVMLSNMGSSQLLFNTKRNRNANALNPDQPFKADVIVYDVFRNIAAAKVVTNKFRFVDYLQLGKFDGEWKIVNVLWEFLQ